MAAARWSSSSWSHAAIGLALMAPPLTLDASNQPAVGIDERGAALDVGESERHAASGVVGCIPGHRGRHPVGQGSSWSLLCKCRGGVTKVA